MERMVSTTPVCKKVEEVPCGRELVRSISLSTCGEVGPSTAVVMTEVAHGNITGRQMVRVFL
jgi:hypothetical protein